MLRVDQLATRREDDLSLSIGGMGGLFVVWRTEHPGATWSLSGGVGGSGGLAGFLAVGKRKPGARLDYGVLLQQLESGTVQRTNRPSIRVRPQLFIMLYVRLTWSPTLWWGEVSRKGEFDSKRLR